MVKLRRTMASALLLGLTAGGDLSLAHEGALPRLGLQEERVNPQAKVLQDFQDRVKTYMELRKQAAGDGPKMEETKDAGKIVAAQDGLAARIRQARANAKQGDIFSPEIARQFRRLMYPEVKGRDGAETKAAIKEDQPGTVRISVNARYPDDEPLPQVPPNLLANLPRLPEELEYRVVRNALILRDVTANLIVDFIPKAIS
ncbi:MAG TPA: hypothetical protein VFO14_22600 [Vicinamibacterales bacterium]|nr:hypothetical protein [Vicinamibacterales bacterium]